MYLVLENRKVDFVSTLTNNSVIKLRNKSVLNPKVSAYHISELRQKIPLQQMAIGFWKSVAYCCTHRRNPIPTSSS